MSTDELKKIDSLQKKWLCLFEKISGTLKTLSSCKEEYFPDINASLQETMFYAEQKIQRLAIECDRIRLLQAKTNALQKEVQEILPKTEMGPDDYIRETLFLLKNQISQQFLVLETEIQVREKMCIILREMQDAAKTNAKTDYFLKLEELRKRLEGGWFY